MIENYINKVIQGDCKVEMAKMPDASFDLICTDPPYGINYQSNMRVMSKKFEKIHDDNNGNRLDVYSEFFRLLKDDCVAIVFCSWKNLAEDYNKLAEYFDIKNVIVWDKGGGGIGDLAHSLLTDYELAIVAHKGQALIRGKRDGSVWREGKVFNMSMLHPTEKPVPLIERIIAKFSDEGAHVLDCYAGGGSTLIACKNLNRKYTGIEINEEYYKVINERLSQDLLFT